MKQTKFTEEQIAMPLHMTDQTSVAKVIRKRGNSARNQSMEVYCLLKLSY
jgi:hypothetical protein